MTSKRLIGADAGLAGQQARQVVLDAASPAA